MRHDVSIKVVLFLSFAKLFEIIFNYNCVKDGFSLKQWENPKKEPSEADFGKQARQWVSGNKQSSHSTSSLRRAKPSQAIVFKLLRRRNRLDRL